MTFDKQFDEEIETQVIALGQNETAIISKDGESYTVRIHLSKENHSNTFYGYPPGSLKTVDQAIEYARNMIPAVYEDYGEYIRSKY